MDKNQGSSIAHWLLAAALLLLIASYYGIIIEGPGEMYPDDLRRAR